MILNEQITRLARQAKAASRDLTRLTTAEKNSCLLAMASALEKNAADIRQANATDMEAAALSGLSSAMLDLYCDCTFTKRRRQDFLDEGQENCKVDFLGQGAVSCVERGERNGVMEQLRREL